MCGQASRTYAYSSQYNPGASDTSADIRPFAEQLKRIMAEDIADGGCNDLAAVTNNFVCGAK